MSSIGKFLIVSVIAVFLSACVSRRITSYNVCYTKLLREAGRGYKEASLHPADFMGMLQRNNFV